MRNWYRNLLKDPLSNSNVKKSSPVFKCDRGNGKDSSKSGVQKFQSLLILFAS